MRKWIGYVVVVLAMAGAAAGQSPAFYRATAKELAGRAGTVIRKEALTQDVPPGATAYRILYRSTGLHGEHIAVSGVMVVPGGNAPTEGRPVVAWQHPTCGVDVGCAPSLSPEVLKMIPGLAGMVRRGFVVVATDYPGMGTKGPHPYLVGISEGRAALDAVRAARSLPEAHAGKRFAVWGHSQGGHASLFAATLARSYAPELQLVGVAAAAPASDLTKMANLDTSNPDGALMGAMLVSTWSRVYHTPLSRIVPRDDIAAVEALAKVCFDPPYDAVEQPADFHPDTPAPQVGWKLSHPLGDTAPWKALLARNTPGLAPRDVPVFLAVGSADTTIPPALTLHYMERLCKAGNAVRLVRKEGVKHRFIARDAAEDAVEWMGDRFAGKKAPDDCGE